MSFKLRLVALSTAWLVFILILFNIFIYFFVVNLTTKSEVQLLWNKANTILQEKWIQDPSAWIDSAALHDYLVSSEMIRIVSLDSEVLIQVASTEVLVDMPTQYSSEFKTDVMTRKDRRIIMVQVPLYHNQEPVGMLEIRRVLNLLTNVFDLLLSALIITSVCAVLLSLFGGYFYTRFLFRPISQLAYTMETIEQNGVFKRLNIAYASKTDELAKLGMTFNRMIGKLEKQFLQQKQFVEDASHELKTPLTVIESYASMLRRWGNKDPKLQAEAIDAIYSESIRLKGLIHSMLELAELERKEPFHMEVFALNPLIQATVNSLQQTFRREIQFVSHQPQIKIRGDAQKVKQLLLIILDNAIKYSSEYIVVEVEQHSYKVLVAVKDRGVGIRRKEIPKIFNRFYRVDQARSRKTGGMGLGLSIAKNIMEQHGGRIDIQSQENLGTTVLLSFPTEW
jgi:two-component system sensor histidine kinase ArlS